MKTIGRLFDMDFRLGSIRALDAGRVLLEMDVTFAARQTGRAVTLSVIERLWIRGGRVARSEVFLSDSAALLATLEPT
jgi:hypothetical protein